MGKLHCKAVVDTLSRQCRDNREIRDCRHAIPALSTENSLFLEVKTPLVATVATVAILKVRQSTAIDHLRQQLYWTDIGLNTPTVQFE